MVAEENKKTDNKSKIVDDIEILESYTMLSIRNKVFDVTRSSSLVMKTTRKERNITN